METISVKGFVKNLIRKIKEEKESKMAFLYSIVYFVFITILLVFGTTGRAQNAARPDPAALEWTGKSPVASPGYTIERSRSELGGN